MMFEQLTLDDLILKISVSEGFLSHISLWTLYITRGFFQEWLSSKFLSLLMPGHYLRGRMMMKVTKN